MKARRDQGADPANCGPDSYEEWADRARAGDMVSGAERWKHIDDDGLFDAPLIRTRLERLSSALRRQDQRTLMFVLDEGVHGNLGGIGNPALYRFTRFGTKSLVNQYTRTVEECIRTLAESDSADVSVDEKREFFQRASRCFGRSALMLSGSGSLSPFHFGVIKQLHELNLLPYVISGSSGGAFVAGVIGTRTKEEMGVVLDPSHLATVISERLNEERTADHYANVMRFTPRLISLTALQRLIDCLIPDLTFEEAHARSGLAINISVTPSTIAGTSRLLNATTCPHVLIRTAVLASCAVPGVFPPASLMARNHNGRSVPYMADHRWIDGSVSDDLPARRLTRLYRVNHFIASQTNPIVMWAVRANSKLGPVRRTVRNWALDVFRANLALTRPLSRLATAGLPGINSMMHMAYSVAMQEYTTDVNIIPDRTDILPWRTLSPLNLHEITNLIEHGRQMTWPHVEQIRICSTIGRTLDSVLSKDGAQRSVNAC